ncbi:hypothetical protein ACFRR7_10195 [Streptomyces sp. NPDC056909]|uniref:hypothetical protein n=1 Tax=Streptomyces sp. NPDC056909 TaxID=3345963 RepID=UPI0036C22D01
MGGDLISARLRRRVRGDFPDAGAARGVEGALSALVGALRDDWHDPAGIERLMAAVVLTAGGDVRRVGEAVQWGLQDWRDLLVAGGLAHEDWPAVLDRELGRLG